MRNKSEHEKMIENYLYFKTILPSSFAKKHIPKPHSSNIIDPFPKYLFNSLTPTNNLYNQTIIVTSGPTPIKRNVSTIPASPKKSKSKKYSKTIEDDRTFFAEGTRYYNPSDIKTLNLYGTSKLLRSSPVRTFEYKNNIYLPSITQRLKQAKPRYDREYNPNRIHQKITINV